MEILNIIRIVIEIVMFLIICIASIYIILYIKKLNSGVTEIVTKVNGIGNDIKPVLNDIGVLTGKINLISGSIQRISGNAENISGKILAKTEEAEFYLDSVRDTAVSKVKNTINMINAVSLGFRSFFRKLNQSDHAHK